MKLVVPETSPKITGVESPSEMYWVLDSPTPLAGMRLPRRLFPWSSLRGAGFAHVVSLHPATLDPAPLTIIASEDLEDLVHGGRPKNVIDEEQKIKRVVAVILVSLGQGQGVVLIAGAAGGGLERFSVVYFVSLVSGLTK
jgi:hypothetical protein